VLTDVTPQRIRDRAVAAVAQARRHDFFRTSREMLPRQREQATLVQLPGNQEVRQVSPTHPIHDHFFFHQLIGHRALVRAFDQEVARSWSSCRSFICPTLKAQTRSSSTC
jgi:hypothetical protein